MLELQNISFAAEDKEILRNVNLKIDDRFVAVTGPNGGGKSTLAKVIMGIDKPDEGRILLDGEDITDLSITERARRGISYAFQQPVRFKGLRVKDLLKLAAGKEASLNDACQVLSEVGLCARDYIDRELNDTLSGGEMKRIEIAMALARGTKLTVFDEPEAGIDLWSFAMLVDTFQKMHDRAENSIMIISHQERIMMLADRILVIDHGRIRTDGTRGEVLPTLLGEFACECDFREAAR